MRASIALGLLLSVLINSAAAVCTLDGVNNCLTEFTSLVSPEGINLTEQEVASVCTSFRESTVECLNQCSGNLTGVEDVEELINKTQTFINTELCEPDSNFTKTLKGEEECIVNASAYFQACYYLQTPPFPNDTSRECCEYRALRNCAPQSVEEKCGDVAAVLVNEVVQNINGAVLEQFCANASILCGNYVAGSVTLASSIFYVLCSFSIVKFSL